MTPGARPHERRRRVVRVPSVVRRAVENAARENAPSQPVKNSGKESRAEFLWPQESGKKSAIIRDVAPKRRFPWRKGRKFRKKPNIFRQATLLERQFFYVSDSLQRRKISHRAGFSGREIAHA